MELPRVGVNHGALWEDVSLALCKYLKSWLVAGSVMYLNNSRDF